MTAAPSLTWPGSRVLAGWWPLLGRWQPRCLWLHHLLLHRVEALVAVARSPSLDLLNRLLLEALTSGPQPGAGLASRLGLDHSFLNRMLAELRGLGLVHSEPEGTWWPTDAGRQALAGTQSVCTLLERRTFWFTEGDARHPGVRFLPLEHPPASAELESGWPFDVRLLHDCIARPMEWKQQNGFPTDVHSLIDTPGPGEWQRVILVQPQQMLTLTVQSQDEHLLGFVTQPPAWSIQTERPVLMLRGGWRDALPELEEPDLGEWRKAWRQWGQPRGLPVGEIEACHLERSGAALRVRAPRPLLERLRAARSDALKGEAWLLAGLNERTRAAAVIELIDASAE
jgi:hypothetical protein